MSNAPYDPHRGHFNAAPAFGQPAPRPQKSSTGLILAIVGAVVFCGLLVCCGGFVWLANFGMQVVAADIESQLRDHPQMQEHIGEIQQFDVSWARSMADDDPDTWMYDVEGTKGKGVLTVESFSGDDTEVITSATLRKSTGETIELDVDYLELD